MSSFAKYSCRYVLTALELDLSAAILEAKFTCIEKLGEINIKKYQQSKFKQISKNAVADNAI